MLLSILELAVQDRQDRDAIAMERINLLFATNRFNKINFRPEKSVLYQYCTLNRSAFSALGISLCYFSSDIVRLLLERGACHNAHDEMISSWRNISIDKMKLLIQHCADLEISAKKIIEKLDKDLEKPYPELDLVKRRVQEKRDFLYALFVAKTLDRYMIKEVIGIVNQYAA